MACLAQIGDWSWLERIEGVISLVGFVMLKWGVLDDFVAEFVEVRCCARDGSSVFHPVMEDREQWTLYAGSKM